MAPKYRSLHPHPYVATEAEFRAQHAKIEADIRRRQPTEFVGRRAARSHHPDVTTDPLDPAIDKWLRSIEARQELVVRYAMRIRFPTVRASQAFSARVAEIEATLRTDDPDRLALIIADAQLVAEQVEDLIDATPGHRAPKSKKAAPG